MNSFDGSEAGGEGFDAAAEVEAMEERLRQERDSFARRRTTAELGFVGATVKC